MKAKGSLILIVMFLIAVIAIIAAIAIPSLLENQKAANNNAAQAMLKAIVTAQSTYSNVNKCYAPSLSALVKSGILFHKQFSSCTAPGTNSRALNGYVFQMTAGRTWTKTSFYVRCKPESRSAGDMCFAVDTTGRVVTTTSY